MRTFLTTKFAGTEGAFDMLQSYVEIVAASNRAPETILVFPGPGGEGKSILLCGLMGAVRGSGHMVAHPSILQTLGGFQRQCQIYRALNWISVDEGRPALCVAVGVFRLFVSGGPLCA